MRNTSWNVLAKMVASIIAEVIQHEGDL